jgi:hypothetical protein
MNTQDLHRAIAEFVQKHPEMTIREISQAINIGYSTLARILANHGVRRRPPHRKINLDVLFSHSGTK